MKILERAAVLLFNLCLFFSVIIISALIIASSPDYYRGQFEKNGLYGEVQEDGTVKGYTVNYIGGMGYNSAVFTKEQLDKIADHTIEYLFSDMESFELTLDGVYMKRTGGYCDGVRIFGDTAVSHMKDVKVLMNTALLGAIIGVFIDIGLLVFFILRRKTVGKIALKYTLIFYTVLIGLALLFCGITFMKSGAEYFISDLWANIHYLLFPFQPEKYANSFFNDTLTSVLTLELFINAVVIVVCVALTFLALWLIVAAMLRRCSKN